MEKYFDTKRFLHYLKLSVIEKKWVLVTILILINFIVIFNYYFSIKNSWSFYQIQLINRFIIIIFLPIAFIFNTYDQFANSSKSVFYLSLPASFFEKWLVIFLQIILLFLFQWILFLGFNAIFLFFYLYFLDTASSSLPSFNIDINQTFVGNDWKKEIIHGIISLPAICFIGNIIFKRPSRSKVFWFIILAIVLYFFAGKLINYIIVETNVNMVSDSIVQVPWKQPYSYLNIQLPTSVTFFNDVFEYLLLPISLIIISILSFKEKELNR